MAAKHGWKKDKWDSKDFIHKPRLVRLPDSEIITSLLPPVPDQGNQGSCVGEGISEINYAAHKSVYAPSDTYSPQWSYNGARAIEGTLSKDDGCFPKDALDWNVEHGCLFEHFWPRTGKFDAAAPSSERMAQAIKYAQYAYFRIDNDIMGICQALADSAQALRDGKPAWLVAIGAPWFYNWYQPNAEGVLADVTERDMLSGGHEYCIYGYDFVKKVFCIQNSWGPGWANAGRAAMPMSAIPAFKALGGYDAHYVTFDVPAPVPEPIPTPTPTPTPTPQPTGWCGDKIVLAGFKKYNDFRKGR